MGIVELRKFDDYNKFIKNEKSETSQCRFTIKDMEKYAVSAGGFSNWAVGTKGTNFYTALVKMAIEDGTNFTIGQDYKKSEQSIKTTISFFMGMIAAKAVADKVYNIPYLFHLKDKQIIFSSSGKTPDFFGLANGKTPFILEAKGTISNSPSKKVVINAKKQIEAINSIKIEGWSTSYSKRDINGHIITSCFEKDILTYYDIDPELNGKTDLTIDIDKAIILYYRNIMNLLMLNETNIYPINENEDKYIMVEVGDYEIGLNYDIYSLLEEYKELYSDSENNIDINKFDFKEKYLQISRIAEKIQYVEYPDSHFSLSSDGILCK